MNKKIFVFFYQKWLFSNNFKIFLFFKKLGIFLLISFFQKHFSLLKNLLKIL